MSVLRIFICDALNSNVPFVSMRIIQILPFTTTTLLSVTPLPDTWVLTEDFTLTLSPSLMQTGLFFVARSETGTTYSIIGLLNYRYNKNMTSESKP